MILLKSLLIPLYIFFYRILLFISKRVEIGNGCYIKSVKFSGKARIEDRCRLSGQPRIKIGNNVYVNAGCHLLGDITIGDNVIVGPQTIFWGRDHGVELGSLINKQPHINGPIIVNEDVWIGAHVTILKGVTIGQGAVVAAGAVVTKDVPNGSIVAGVPAKIIRMRK